VKTYLKLEKFQKFAPGFAKATQGEAKVKQIASNPANMKKLEHIGIAVSNLEESNRLFARLLGVSHYKIEDVPSEGVRTSFFMVGDIKIELLEATTPDSPIAKFIEKKGEGVHHLAFATDNLVDEMRSRKQGGFQLLSDAPRQGADNKQIAFLHPKSTNGVLIELCADIQPANYE
jgi:methylmalonyl-CoA/ethylmalonyl-CoA epimerase